MNKKFLLLLMTMVFSINAIAQTFTLKGKVTDEEQNQGKVTMTSLKGEFSITLQSADSVAVQFSMIGYKTKTRVLRNPRGIQTLQIVLYEDNRTLSEVSVTGQKIQTGQTQELKTEQLKSMPSASGNAVEELIQSQEGVSTHSELSSQYNVGVEASTRTPYI